jgi:hypothetical protein
MRTFMGSLVLVMALSFLGLPSAMADDPTPPAVTKDADTDKDPKHRRHHRHHHKHHHHRHHKHNPPKPDTTPEKKPDSTNS